eukprot:436687-Prymnesium_polylepis.1
MGRAGRGEKMLPAREHQRASSVRSCAHQLAHDRSSTVRRRKAGLGKDTSAQRVLTSTRGEPRAGARHSHHRWPPRAAYVRSRRGR